MAPFHVWVTRIDKIIDWGLCGLSSLAINSPFIYFHKRANPLRDIVKCCGWRREHPDGLSGGFDVSVLKFNALEDEFNEFVTV